MSTLALGLSVAIGAPVEGTWRADPDSDAVAENIRNAVDAALADGVSAAERPVARWLLLRATRPCGTVEVDVRDGELAIRCDEQKTAVAPSDGTPVPFEGADGRALTLVHGLVDEHTVTQSFRTREGTRTSRLTILPDGTLEMVVSIRSERLSGPLEYTLTYLR